MTGPVGGVQTLERSYLLRINGTVVERPQHMLMRVAVGIHKQVFQVTVSCAFTLTPAYA